MSRKDELQKREDSSFAILVFAMIGLVCSLVSLGSQMLPILDSISDGLSGSESVQVQSK